MHDFEKRIAAQWPPEKWRGVTSLVGVSGGADSTALLLALHRLRQSSNNNSRIVAAHLNHNLRGDESLADARFVQKLAQELGCDCVVEERRDAANASEQLSRNARYAFFEATAKRLGARCIALAHTADDQIETVLHRIIRGTSLHGLSGISFSRSLGEDLAIVRPMLKLRRADVEKYLLDCNQPYCTDSTNAASAYTRNRIRNELLPRLRTDYNPQVDDAILKLGAMSQEVSELVESLAAAWAEKYAKIVSKDRIEITAPTESQNQFLVCEAIRKLWRQVNWPQQGMDYDHWRALGRLLLTEGGETTLPTGIVARKRDGKLFISIS